MVAPAAADGVAAPVGALPGERVAVALGVAVAVRVALVAPLALVLVARGAVDVAGGIVAVGGGAVAVTTGVGVDEGAAPPLLELPGVAEEVAVCAGVAVAPAAPGVAEVAGSDADGEATALSTAVPVAVAAPETAPVGVALLAGGATVVAGSGPLAYVPGGDEVASAVGVGKLPSSEPSSTFVAPSGSINRPATCISAGLGGVTGVLVGGGSDVAVAGEAARVVGEGGGSVGGRGDGAGAVVGACAVAGSGGSAMAMFCGLGGSAMVEKRRSSWPPNSRPSGSRALVSTT
jgi:hypothetical protein